MSRSTPTEKIDIGDGTDQPHTFMKTRTELESQLRHSIQMQIVQNYDQDVFQRAADPSLAIEPLDFDQISTVLHRIQTPRDLALELEATRVWMISAECPKTREDLGPVVSRIAKVRLTQLFRALLALKAERKW